MNNSVRVAVIQKIADSKGLTFEFNEIDQSFVMLDKRTREVLMVYAMITVSLITNDGVWRAECNKLKAQSFR